MAQLFAFSTVCGKKMLRNCCLAMCVIGSLGTFTKLEAAPAASAEDVEEAKLRFEAGQQAFKAGRFRAALEEFQGGYVLTRNSGFLLNIAVCYRKLDEHQQALDHFRDYLQQTPDSPKRAEVDKHIAELEALLGLHAPAPAAGLPPAAVLADGSRDPAAPLPLPTRPPGPVEQKPGARVDDADEDEGVALVVSSRRARSSAPSVEPRPDEESQGSRHLWLWGGLGVAVVAGVVAAFALAGNNSVSPTLGAVDLR